LAKVADAPSHAQAIEVRDHGCATLLGRKRGKQVADDRQIPCGTRQRQVADG
jgi:hypothetical protein